MLTQTRHSPPLTRQPRRHNHHLLGWLCALLICTGPLLAAQPFSVQGAKTTLTDGVYRLDALLTFALPKKVLEALDNGIPLTFALDIDVRQPRRYLWDEHIASLEQRTTIQYFALTEQYLLRNLNSGHEASYSTLASVLRALGDIRSLPIIDAKLLDPDEYYMVSIRSYLDFESLPVPLRMRAYISQNWWLTSGWYSWDLGMEQ
ncbi:MAG: DUF4390 domain-containing protein [Gammaproteobacteria bacterium]|nr:DUF4390 domain-containing protein [Gammaproteobacteria bacterium]MCF6362937.1 DUF4390 domain-containing protein [Gammaproteobacteria bacterium]